MARAPVLAAGGIVIRRQQPPLIAVVRLRKRDEWVLPKGKLDDGETAKAAARREVLEETGYNATVQEFLGTLALEAGGRCKIVHFWRMEASGDPVGPLMRDIREVDWLPLNTALARLSRGYEQAFLAQVGPLALAAMARSRLAKPKPAAAKKRRGQDAATPELPPAVMVPMPSPIEAELAPMPREDIPAEMPEVEAASIEASLADAAPLDFPVPAPELASEAELSEVDVMLAEAMAEAPVAEMAGDGEDAPDRIAAETSQPVEAERRTLAQRVREWLGRAA
jgi:8-oxo-dGTP diphosphatase